MAASDWSAVTLCTYADVKEEFPEKIGLDRLTGEASAADAKDAVEAKIAKAKERIGDRLLADLRDRIFSMNLDADVDIRDWIHNPTIFKNACVFMTLHLLCNANVMHPDDLYSAKSEYYLRQFKDEMNMATALVQFDSDDDAAMDELEASRSTMAFKLTRV